MQILDPLSEAKSVARNILRDRRENLDPGTRASHSAVIQSHLFQLPEVQAAGVIFCFISSGTEVSTRTALDRFLAMGKTVLAPRILRGESMRAVPFRGWDSLVPGVLGIPAPVETDPHPGRVDLVITPGLGFTPAGTRLGYGRGYYDQWFANHEHGLRVGVAFECQLEPDLPSVSSDVPVNIIVTEQRTIFAHPGA